MSSVRADLLEKSVSVAGLKVGVDNRNPISPLLISEVLRFYDLAAVAIVGFAGFMFRVGGGGRAEFYERNTQSILLALVLGAIVCQWFNAYDVDIVYSRWLGLRRTLAAWGTTFALLLLIVFALKITAVYSRVWGGSWLIGTAALLVIGRLVLGAMTQRWAQAGRFSNRALIVGLGDQGQRLAAHFRERARARTRIIGLIDDCRTSARPEGSRFGYPVLGGVGEMMQLIRQNAVDEVIIALPWSQEESVRELMLQLATTPVRVCLAPDLVGFQFADRKFTSLAGLPSLNLFDRPISGRSHAFKLIEDLAIAGIALLFMAPLMLVVAAAISIDSPGPVLFKQRRFGFNNNLIEVWKFRTMRTDCADADADVQTTKQDPRVTRVGRFLRKSSLDELPQLINVLRGEMSIVGPRPHAVATKAEGRLFENVVYGYAARHRVKPGITGWAQVNGWRGETDTIDKIRKRVEYDLYYIDHWSVWLDLYIMIKTCLVVFRDENAY
jgi:Undecaprenyl-phosphate glucose phosphotransferase